MNLQGPQVESLFPLQSLGVCRSRGAESHMRLEHHQPTHPGG